MGLFDRFKSKKEGIGKDKKPKHVVAKSSKEQAEEAKRRQFAAVPAAGDATPKREAKSGAKSDDRARQRQHQDDTGDAYRVLIRGVISEKATLLSTRQQYVFAVSSNANKIDIRRAVFSLYGIRPQKVNIVNVQGKSIRYGKNQGQTRNWKKAIVTLQPGQKIDIHGT